MYNSLACMGALISEAGFQKSWSDPSLDLSAATCPLLLSAGDMLASLVLLKKHQANALISGSSHLLFSAGNTILQIAHASIPHFLQLSV